MRRTADRVRRRAAVDRMADVLSGRQIAGALERRMLDGTSPIGLAVVEQRLAEGGQRLVQPQGRRQGGLLVPADMEITLEKHRSASADRTYFGQCARPAAATWNG